MPDESTRVTTHDYELTDLRPLEELLAAVRLHIETRSIAVAEAAGSVNELGGTSVKAEHLLAAVQQYREARGIYG